MSTGGSWRAATSPRPEHRHGGCCRQHTTMSDTRAATLSLTSSARQPLHSSTSVTGSTATNMKKVLAHKRDMVDGLIAMHLDNYKASGAELIMGTGRFIAPKTIEVSLNDGGTRVLTGDRVALNLGTHATIPDIPGLVAAEPLTNVQALELDRMPDHLIVLGGGYVGLELAQ